MCLFFVSCKVLFIICSMRKFHAMVIINPRHACAARVTSTWSVSLLFVCLSVYDYILALQAMRQLMSDTNRFSATRE